MLAVLSTACTYNAFTDSLSNCGTGTSAGLVRYLVGGGVVLAQPLFGMICNGFTVAGGLSAVGGAEGLFAKESLDVYGVQAAYNTDSLVFHLVML